VATGLVDDGNAVEDGVAPPSSATERESKTLENPLPPSGGAKQVAPPCRLRKRVQHSLFFSIVATTFGIAFYIMLLLGFVWLLRADIIFLK